MECKYAADMDILVRRLAAGERPWAESPELVKQERLQSSAAHLYVKQSTGLILDRLLERARDWFNELVLVGERVRAANRPYDVDKLVESVN